jgi:hypothetical protein
MSFLLLLSLASASVIGSLIGFPTGTEQDDGYDGAFASCTPTALGAFATGAASIT